MTGAPGFSAAPMLAASVLATVALALVLSGCQKQPEKAAETAPLAERPDLDPLAGARAAMEGRDWTEAIQLAQLAIDADVDADAARELVATARFELENRATLADARALFEGGLHAKAYLKLVEFPPESAYETQASNMLVRIRQAVVLPPSVRRAGGTAMRRVVIGSFLRGTSEKEAKRAHKLCEEYAGKCELAWFDRETPRKRLIIGSFYLDETEVAVEAYRACVAVGNCTAVDWSACGLDEAAERAEFDQADLPQVCVTHEEARAYCSFVGGRLPTEAEWEHAASSGTRFPWGKAFRAAQANWGDDRGASDGFETLAPADAFPRAANGLRNMAGNAYEWVADWYDESYYGTAPSSRPPGPETGTQRVIRGGAFNATPSSLRVAHRNRLAPGDRNKTVGFRCAADPHRLPFPGEP